MSSKNYYFKALQNNTIKKFSDVKVYLWYNKVKKWVTNSIRIPLLSFTCKMNTCTFGHSHQRKSLACYIFSTAWAISTMLCFFSPSFSSHHWAFTFPVAWIDLKACYTLQSLSYPGLSCSCCGIFFHILKGHQWMILAIMKIMIMIKVRTMMTTNTY